MDTFTSISHARLAAQGYSANDIAGMVRDGSLARIRPGVYASEALEDAAERHLRLIHATLPLVETSNVVSYESAALLHGLPIPEIPDAVVMTRITTGHADASSALRVRDTRLDPHETEVIDGVLVTTLARTAVDVARRHQLPWSVAVCDAALRLGATRTDLKDALLSQKRLHGVPRARAAVRLADVRAESPAESISRINMALAGVPEPELQGVIRDDYGSFVARCDFLWPELRLVGEVDGRVKYGELLQPGQRPEDAVMAEKRREARIREEGFWVVRWDFPTACSPGALSQRIGQAIRLQRDRLGLPGTA